MKTLKIIIVLILSCKPLFAGTIEIKDQKKYQSSCVQQRLKTCLEKLCAVKKDSCVETCEETVRNQCRYAGE